MSPPLGEFCLSHRLPGAGGGLERRGPTLAALDGRCPPLGDGRVQRLRRLLLRAAGPVPVAEALALRLAARCGACSARAGPPRGSSACFRARSPGARQGSGPASWGRRLRRRPLSAPRSARGGPHRLAGPSPSDGPPGPFRASFARSRSLARALLFYFLRAAWTAHPPVGGSPIWPDLHSFATAAAARPRAGRRSRNETAQRSAASATRTQKLPPLLPAPPSSSSIEAGENDEDEEGYEEAEDLGLRSEE